MHGATKWLFLFNTELAERGYDSTILCTFCGIPIPFWFKGTLKNIFPTGARSLDFSGVSKLLFLAFQLLMAPFMIFFIPRKTEVIIYHGELSIFAFITAKLFFPRAKHIYYCYSMPRELYDLKKSARQSYGLWYDLLSPLFFVYKFLDRSLVRLSSSVLVWSKEHEEFVKSIYGNLNYIIVPAAVDFGPYVQNDEIMNKVKERRSEFGLDGKVVFLMNASLTTKKRVHIFIEMINQMISNGSIVHGIVIGEGPEQHNLDSLIGDLKIRDHFTLLGYVSQEDLPIYCLMSDVFLYLEPRGVWSMSVIEAGACKKPVIVAEGGSMPTLVAHEKSGFIVPESELMPQLVGYATQITDSNELRSSLGEYNYTHSIQFSLGHVIDDFTTFIYTDISI